MRTPVSRRPSGMLALLAVIACAVSTAGGQEERQPIIARMQVLYSMVSHKMHLSDRISFYNINSTNPKGANYYIVPHLVYEPFVTLYNPYNTVLTLPRARVRLANPPVGFKFKKDGVYLRPEWESGDTFFGLGRFQAANEANANAQKTFTLSLGGGNRDDYAGPIVLQPGQSRSFCVRLESNWNWGLETAGGLNPRSFFDWDNTRDFTNRDARTNNPFGVEAIGVEYLDFRAGFQTDWLSLSSGRPAATIYSFETASYGGSGWVAIKGLSGAPFNGTIRMEAKGLRSFASSSVPDFQLSLLRGEVVDPVADTAREYSFSVDDLVRPGNGGAGNTVPGGRDIDRTYSAFDLLQQANDNSVAGKSPFAVFTIVAKSKALQRKLFQSGTQVPETQLYETRLDEATDFYGTLDGGPSDGYSDRPVVTGVERVGDFLMLDVVSVWDNFTARIKGTTDPALGFPDDLTASCEVTDGPAWTGIFKVKVPVAGRGDRYFVRIEGY
jgi:hypothetical protein